MPILCGEVGWWVLPLRCFSGDCSPLAFENYYMPKGRNPANTCSPLHLGRDVCIANIFLLDANVYFGEWLYMNTAYTFRYMVLGSICRWLSNINCGTKMPKRPCWSYFTSPSGCETQRFPGQKLSSSIFPFSCCLS